MWVNKRVPILNRINEIEKELNKTDYIDNKRLNAVVKFILTGDRTELEALNEEYKEEIAQREAWRDEINALEKELSEVTNNVGE